MIDARKTNGSPSFAGTPRKRRILPVISCLGCLLLGAAGLGGAVTLEARATGAESAPPPSTAKAPAAPAKAPAPASRKQSAPQAEGEAAAPSAVAVPDFKGKRLSVAMRQARKLGLVLLATGTDGARIPPGLASGYRVRRQEAPANALVEPGTIVEVHVRESVDVAQGY